MDYVFSLSEQGLMDESANSFLEKYSTDEEAAADVIKVHATDVMMPQTTISEEEIKKCIT